MTLCSMVRVCAHSWKAFRMWLKQTFCLCLTSHSLTRHADLQRENDSMWHCVCLCTHMKSLLRVKEKMTHMLHWVSPCTLTESLSHLIKRSIFLVHKFTFTNTLIYCTSSKTKYSMLHCVCLCTHMKNLLHVTKINVLLVFKFTVTITNTSMHLYKEKMTLMLHCRCL